MVAGCSIDDHAVDDLLNRVVLVMLTTRISIAVSWRGDFPPSPPNIGPAAALM